MADRLTSWLRANPDAPAGVAFMILLNPRMPLVDADAKIMVFRNEELAKAIAESAFRGSESSPVLAKLKAVGLFNPMVAVMGQKKWEAFVASEKYREYSSLDEAMTALDKVGTHGVNPHG